ncbi:MAG TPA: threonine synthase [Candidatus Binataceae bacterium]|jgi:threonine synthase|nr:threonine synthase [Candidatus Binataceae bacterium]
MKSLLDHLQCTACGRRYSADDLHTVCPDCGKVLFARYDLDAAKGLTPHVLDGRPWTMWRYGELMPVRREENIVTLGEGMTPLLRASRLGRIYAFEHLFIKEEGLNPTGSFKARGMSAALSRARELGVTSVAAPSAGNAAGALAAYGAAAGIETSVVMPSDAPEINKIESYVCGARVYLVKGLISDAAKVVQQAGAKRGWFDVSTLKEPYRVEGKKTMGLELAEQFNWQLPDAIIYPTGGGTGMIGMWKAFEELQQLGWIDAKRPKMISVQAAGCAPIVQAFLEHRAESEVWKDAQTIAAGLRVPHAFADYLILRTIRESGGTAVAVSDAEIIAAIHELARTEGLFVCPEGAAAWAAFKHLAASRFLHPQERVVLFNTGSGLKYPDLVQVQFPIIDASDPGAIDSL